MTRVNHASGNQRRQEVRNEHAARPAQKPAPQKQAAPKKPPQARHAPANTTPTDHVASRNVIANRHEANLRAWQPSSRNVATAAQTVHTQAGAHVTARASANRTLAGNQSRFNRPLQTNRPPGDPDRSREVNPQRVGRHEGHAVYPARVRADANFFDKQHRSTGRVGTDRLDIDFTVPRRRMAGPDGVKHLYVYARRANADGTTTGGYVRQSAFVDLQRDVKEDAFRFPLTPGPHQLVDGAGVSRGAVVDSRGVKLNYAQQKEIGGERYYYAFDVMVDHDNNPRTERKHMSGWVHESAIPAGIRPRWRTGDDAKVAPAAPTRGAAPQPRTITGGTDMVRRSYDGLRVTPESRGGIGRRSPKDYLGRPPDGAVNLLYNLPGSGGRGGGFSTDTLRPGATFYRTPSVEPVRIPLYRADSSEPTGRTMTYVYGYVQDPVSGDKRHGWIANEALS